MVSKEEIEKVEKLQKLEKELKDLKDDYYLMRTNSLGWGGSICCHSFNNDYKKDMLRIIKHRILKKKAEIKRYKEG